MENVIGELRHMFMTVFLSGFAGFMVAPVITDVTVAAVCSGPDDSCSLAVYLTGFQQVAIGVGTMIMMPVMGNLSDRYGIRTILTLPMCLSILPPVILGYRRDAKFFYLYYISKILTSMVCQGTIDCLAYAYVAENIHGSIRISAFGILAGIKTIAGLFGTIVARFLPIALTFQVSAISFFFGMVYMRVFLKEKLNDNDDDHHGGTQHREDDDSNNVGMLAEPILNDTPIKTPVFHKKYSSLKDMISLTKTRGMLVYFGDTMITYSFMVLLFTLERNGREYNISESKWDTIFVQALIVTFFSSLAASGMESSFLYVLKARFGFDKKQFADLLLLITIVGSISQLLILPKFGSAIGERKLLSTGLFMEFLYMAIVSISWAPWVPYLTTIFMPGAFFVTPSICGIASRQVGPGEQGKVQGCISGVSSFGKVVGPFVFSPLTALFLSENAPFYFPGFSLLCISLSSLIAFIQSLLIENAPTPPLNEAINKTSGEEV